MRQIFEFLGFWLRGIRDGWPRRDDKQFIAPGEFLPDSFGDERRKRMTQFEDTR